MKLKGGWRCKTLSGAWVECNNDKYKIQAVVFDKPSHYGINSGRVSKLWVHRRADRKEVLAYDRGWEKKSKDYKKYLKPVMAYAKRRK